MTIGQDESHTPRSPARLPAVDALRGVAILGILLMNVTAFAMPYDAYTDPHVWGGDSLGNLTVFRLERVFVAGKMMALLSMLFGAGLLLRTSATTGSHARRMLVLVVIGMAHAYLLWYGDILVAYAIAGLIAFPLRRLPAAALLGAGAFALLLTCLLGVVPLDGGWTMPTVAQEVGAYRGPYLGEFADRVIRSERAQTIDLLAYSLPQIVGLMLLGMGLTKLGVLTGRASTKVYATIAAFTLPIGWAITATAGMVADLIDPFLAALVAVGYVAALVSIFRQQLPRSLVAVGRTALSCYLAQTLICTTLFYGHGLAWFGHVDRVHQLGVVLGVWIVLLVAAPLWLSRFKLGPMEWLWRTVARSR